MAKNNPWAYDSTAANNTDIGGTGISGSSTALNFVTWFQNIMSQLKAFFARGADFATAGTLVLDNSPNLYVDLSGTTTVTAVTLTNGNWIWARAQAAFTLTASSTLIVNGSTSLSYTTNAGDLLFFAGYGSSTVRVWVTSAQTVGSATAADVYAASSSTKYISPSAAVSSLAEVVLTDGATVTIDFSTGINFKLDTIGGNRTLAASNVSTALGRSGYIRVKQDGTGSRTLDMSGSPWVNGGGTNAVLSTAAAATDYIFYQISGVTSTVLLTIVKAVS